MLVIDIFNSKSPVLEFGIINTLQNPEGYKNSDVYIYKFGIIVQGKIPVYIGEVIHKQSYCGLKLVKSVFEVIVQENLLLFDKKIFKKYFINISINRRKLIEELVVINNKNTLKFDIFLKPIFDKNKPYYIYSLDFIDKNNFPFFIFQIVSSLIVYDNQHNILNDRKKDRENKEFFELAKALNF